MCRCANQCDEKEKRLRVQVTDSARRNNNTALEENGIEAKESSHSNIPTRQKKDQRSENAAIRKITTKECRHQLAAIVETATNT
jgi:hypothetical protein